MLFAKLRHRCEYNIKMNLRKIGCMGLNGIILVQDKALSSRP
jgi:hypothetical protein